MEFQWKSVHFSCGSLLAGVITNKHTAKSKRPGVPCSGYIHHAVIKVRGVVVVLARGIIGGNVK